jgi:hypothetical protein
MPTSSKGILATLEFYDLPKDEELTQLRIFIPVEDWDYAETIADIQRRRLENCGTTINTISLQSAVLHIDEGRCDKICLRPIKSRK